MSALRLPFAAGSGTLITLGLFAVLLQLVSAPVRFEKARPTRKIDFTPKIVEEPIASKRDPKPERERPPRLADSVLIGIDSGSTGLSTPVVLGALPTPDVPRGGGLPVGQDGDALPLVRVNPEYPARAARLGIEGWVQVRFTVSAAGSVRDARVVAAEPRGEFEEAALRAVSRWRYRPSVANGVPVERVGLETVIRFELER